MGSILDKVMMINQRVECMANGLNEMSNRVNLLEKKKNNSY